MIKGDKAAGIRGFIVKEFYVNALASMGADIDVAPVLVTLDELVGAGIGLVLCQHCCRAMRQEPHANGHRAIATSHQEVEVVPGQGDPLDLDAGLGGS